MTMVRRPCRNSNFPQTPTTSREASLRTLPASGRKKADFGSDVVSGLASLPSLQTTPCPAAQNFSSLTPSGSPADA
eukprot:5596921-Alexandrium_andersonii.AAC.1